MSNEDEKRTSEATPVQSSYCAACKDTGCSECDGHGVVENDEDHLRAWLQANVSGIVRIAESDWQALLTLIGRRRRDDVLLLRGLEWSGGAQAGIGDGCDACCPSCGAWAHHKKHQPGCALASAIGAAPRPNEATLAPTPSQCPNAKHHSFGKKGTRPCSHCGIHPSEYARRRTAEIDAQRTQEEASPAVARAMAAFRAELAKVDAERRPQEAPTPPTPTRENWPFTGTCAQCPQDPDARGMYDKQRPWECENRDRYDHRHVNYLTDDVILQLAAYIGKRPDKAKCDRCGKRDDLVVCSLCAEELHGIISDVSRAPCVDYGPHAEKKR